jgi:hypothetical protein
MRQPALLLLLPTILIAQGIITVGGGAGSFNLGGPTSAPPAVPPQPTKPEDLCSVEGQVVNAVTGEPIRRASILLMRSEPVPGETGPPTSYSTQSNSSGQFAMKDVEPGKYRLTVNRNGYVSFTYGARGPMQPGTTLSLIRQQHMADLALRLTPQAVITGRILDDEGEPVANAQVALESYRYINGRKQLTPSFLGGGNTTNDLGEYRLFGLAPGKYYVSAVGQMFTVGRSASAGPEEVYVPTYYPGTVDPSAASQLDVPAGGQLSGIDMVLSKGRTVHVKGRITHGLSGRPNVSLFLSPRNPGAMMGPMRSNPIDAAGNFDIRNVTPGQYTLTARLNEGGMSRQTRVAVDVGSTNVEGLNIVIGPGITVKGHLRAEGDSATVDLSNVRLSLQPRESGGIMFGAAGQSKMNAEGLFEISNAAADRYNLFVSGLPSGAYVKAIRSDQVDVLASGLDMTSGASPADIEIVISPKAAAVTGVVQNPTTGNPMPGAMVVLIPQDQQRKEQLTYYKFINSDQNGAFSLTGLTPGEYKAFAWEDIEIGAYMDPDFMKPIEEKGETVSLQEGEQKTLTLKVIPVLPL